jgi:hypothetical protein
MPEVLEWTWPHATGGVTVEHQPAIPTIGVERPVLAGRRSRFRSTVACHPWSVAEIADGVSVLSEDECWQLVNDAEVGRLAFAVAGEPEIFPVNFVVDGRSLLFRTAEGTKLAGLTVSSRVAFEVDGYEPNNGEAWSVVLKGQAERLEHFPDIYAAERLPIFPWQALPKQWIVRIMPTKVTGRRFTVVRGPRED